MEVMIDGAEGVSGPAKARGEILVAIAPAASLVENLVKGRVVNVQFRRRDANDGAYRYSLVACKGLGMRVHLGTHHSFYEALGCAL